MTIIEKRREETYVDLRDKLNRYGKCALVRPTGFGKTGILTRLLKEYNNVIYLYPAEVVVSAVKNFYGSDEVQNTKFITYSKLINLTKEDLEGFGDVDLILCDECHRLGATRTCKAMRMLIDFFPNAHLVGATATPDRMDLIDEISEFFNDIVVSEYTLHDAFKDGVLKKPVYCYCSYGVEDSIRVERETRLEVEKMDSQQNDALDLLRSRLIEISNLQKMDKVIKETCDKYLDKGTDYVKFIIFFSDFKHIAERGDEVRSWFEGAFKGWTTSVLRITSDTEEFTENVHKLDSLQYRHNHVDLIYCVEMLNMGYHVNNLTGIGMYRGTQSGIVFSQQLGRVLSTGADKPAIVFDFVDNLHRESVYQVLGRKARLTQERQVRRSELRKKEKEGTITEEEKKELDHLIKVMSGSTKWWTHANDLMPEDLITAGHMATYRELIAKTVAEPIAMRCRQAWARWKEQGGDDSVMTRDAILSKVPPKFVPLEPFCRLKNVTVNQVLKEMGL